MVKSFTGAVALQLCDEGQVGEEDGKGGWRRRGLSPSGLEPREKVDGTTCVVLS